MPLKKFISIPTLIDTLGPTVTASCRIEIDCIVAPRNVSLGVTIVGSSARSTEPERRGVLHLVQLLPEGHGQLVEVGCGLQEKVLVLDRIDDDLAVRLLTKVDCVVAIFPSATLSSEDSYLNEAFDARNFISDYRIVIDFGSVVEVPIGHQVKIPVFGLLCLGLS